MYKFKIKSDGEGGILYMTREEKLKFYKEVKKKLHKMVKAIQVC